MDTYTRVPQYIFRYKPRYLGSVDIQVPRYCISSTARAGRWRRD